MSDPSFRPNAYSEEQIQKKVSEALAGSQVFIQNPNGDGYHFDLVVVWAGFSGMSRVHQHQKILNLFKDDFASNALHAMTLKLFTPEGWQEASKNAKVSIQ